ncbi:MAG: alpha-2-macroglobulin [Planctomycetaceae bacterium]|jgi:uncharacterized protein YfaS (alpha-2-macroglobulin family)|nr:alpha-2-macroglobulin [Planctomycetaceae bacterium]
MMNRLFLPFILMISGSMTFAAENNPIPQADKLIREGLHKDALDLLRPWMLDAKNVTESTDVRTAVKRVADTLQQLNQSAEIDAFLEEAAEIHKNNRRVLRAVADTYRLIPHYGVIVDGKFQRGPHRGGNAVDSSRRDRIRALQLYTAILPMLPKKTENQVHEAEFFLNFADIFLETRQFGGAWQLQILSDLTLLPDYEERRYRYAGASYAPVDEDGNPVFYYVPDSFETAKNDGERWRWTLKEAVRYDESNSAAVLMRQADFYRTQFGTETLSSFGYFHRPAARNKTDESGKTASILSLETLPDEETIAQLATGIKRFTLPDEFNPIKLLQKVFKTEPLLAAGRLAQIYTNRLQFGKAAQYYRKTLELNGKDTHSHEQLDQIVKNWGRFEPAGSRIAGLNAELRYIFRNGKKVSLTVHEVNVRQLMDDIKVYLKSEPKQLDWRQTEIDNIGSKLVFDKPNREFRKKYLGKKIAQWSVNLTPAAKHFDKTEIIHFSYKKSGAYLIRAEMENGNAESALLWLDDTAVVMKPLAADAKSLYYLADAKTGTQSLYYTADAQTGEPIASADVNVFGYRVEYKNLPEANNRRRQDPNPTWIFQEENFKTDENGLCFIPTGNRGTFTTLFTVNNGERFAFLGFNPIWYSGGVDRQNNNTKAFIITDRPVYRPKDKVQIKVWLGSGQYEQPEKNAWAEQPVNYTVRNPRNELFVEKKGVLLDQHGGLTAELELPKDAMLGEYNIIVGGSGSATFRVEEYRKPEYEVSIDSPKDPVALGGKITATVKAKYYFGSPVVNAAVKYKVLRQKANADWYPICPWDWLYGNGYGWLAYDADFLPRWGQWGCCRPMPPWLPIHQGPPEVVAEAETKIKPDGTAEIVIDTAAAKEMFPDEDQRYTITAEVVDTSRRTITASGNVLVSRKPFNVYAWGNRGYFTEDQKIAARFQARRLDGKPVSGTGTAKLFLLSYAPDGAGKGVRVTEKEVYTENVTFNTEGTAQFNMNAAQAGQYRLSCTLNGQEGGYVFNIYPLKNTADKKIPDKAAVLTADRFKYHTLELIPDKTEYAPQETVKLRVNADRENAALVLLVRKQKPVLLRLIGKSAEVEIPVEKSDMPNFFVEALTVAGGEVISEVKEIVVPPQKKVLNVEVKPESETYKPGSKAKAKLIVTDIEGKPVTAQLAVAVYDKSVEYISGGSNVEDIKKYFWSWHRFYEPALQSNLRRLWYGMPDPDKPPMQPLGLFGNTALRNFGISRSSMKKSDGVKMLSEAAPAAPAGAMDSSGNISGAVAESNLADGGQASEQGAPAAVRTNFADTALWLGAVETDKNGVAEIELTMPESLTAWKINVWSMAEGTRVGYGNTEVITRKDLILRMLAPRFLTEHDQCTFSAAVHNYTASEQNVAVSCETSFTPASAKQVRIKPNGETRIDWNVEAKQAGEMKVRMTASADGESDGVEQTLPVYVHGMLKTDSYSAFIAAEKSSAAFDITVPAESKTEQRKLTVKFTPSLAASMMDALPYLVEYPYGCTEQTLNRFLPAVIIRQHISPKGRKPEQIVTDEMIQDGIKKLANMQCSGGGWGWFSGYGETGSAHLTALVVHGLQLAETCDVKVPPEMLQRGQNWLKQYQREQLKLLKSHDKKHNKEYADETDAFVLMVLSERYWLPAVDVPTADMLNFLRRDKGHLSPYGVAMLGIADSSLPGKHNLDEYVKILEQYLVIDNENQTAYLNLQSASGWCWWTWHGSEFETQAYYLKLLMRSNPKSPHAPPAVKYLLNNRKHATYWNSTRDTAICIEAFAEFLRTSGENKPDVTVDVLLDGVVKKTVHFTEENLLTADNTLVLEKDAVTSGKHTVELRTHQTSPQPSPLYITAFLENFTLENPIKKAGLDVRIERKIYKLVRNESANTQVAGGSGQVVSLKTEKYNRIPADELSDRFHSGDLIEIELTIDSKNDYESILIEDRKAAGLEPVDVRSGYNGNELGAYSEFRDERVAFFVYRLMRGKHSLTYRLRAEQPGEFSALPAKIEAMYAPELRGNSDENKVKVGDNIAERSR